MNLSPSYHFPTGLSPVPTLQISRAIAAPILALRSTESGAGLSPASTASIVTFLSLFGLAALAFVICCMRKRRILSQTVSNERPLEKASVRDVEALAGGERPIIPVTPRQDVRWTPQIRSISGPALNKGSDRKIAALPPKRARSPPPLLKPQALFLDSHAKSAPAHALSFSPNEIPRPAKSSKGDLSPPVTPHALAVSGMQTRFLGKPGSGSES